MAIAKSEKSDFGYYPQHTRIVCTTRTVLENMPKNLDNAFEMIVDHATVRNMREGQFAFTCDGVEVKITMRDREHRHPEEDVGLGTDDFK